MNFKTESNRIYLSGENGTCIAEITFPSVKDGVVDINHTFVDDSLRGQGIAGKLMELAVRQIKANGQKAVCSCSYAQKWFERHEEEQNVLAEE